MVSDLSVKAITAAGILLVTWLLAKLAKWAFAKLVDKTPVLRTSRSDGDSVGGSLGKIVSLFIWLFGLIAILQIFNLDAVSRPLDTLLNQVAGFVPNLVGAGLIFFIGIMIARIAKQIVETALITINAQSWAQRAGLARITGSVSQLATTIGTIVFVLIAIPVSIAALEQLQIESIAYPATTMLQIILTAIPLVIGAALVLAVGYLIARWVANLMRRFCQAWALTKRSHP